jgi:two-component system chemotaxis response regulator CheY
MLKALIVDDESSIRKIISIWLAPYFKFDLAADGWEAVDAVRKSFETKAPYDLVCMDIMMPGLSGIEALRTIRETEERNGVPPGKGSKIVMTTAAANPKNIIGAFNEQCEAYLIKPVQQEEMIAALKKIGFNISNPS